MSSARCSCWLYLNCGSPKVMTVTHEAFLTTVPSRSTPSLTLGLVTLFISFISPNTVCRRRQWHPTPVLLPGKSHGRRSLVGCNPWGCWGSDTTEWLHFHFSLSCTGEGNGNPLQCSCLENPRDGEAWWAAVYGVTQSQTWLKWLSSSSSSNTVCNDLIYLFVSCLLLLLEKLRPSLPLYSLEPGTAPGI